MLQTVECYRSHLPYPHKITPAYKNSSTVFQKTKKSSFQTETPKNFVELFWILLFLIRKGGSQIAAWRDGERRIEGKRERERRESTIDTETTKKARRTFRDTRDTLRNRERPVFRGVNSRPKKLGTTRPGKGKNAHAKISDRNSEKERV